LRTAVVLSWSGGKDSSLALQALRADPAIEVIALLTTVTRGYDRISVHGASCSSQSGCVARSRLTRLGSRLRRPFAVDGFRLAIV